MGRWLGLALATAVGAVGCTTSGNVDENDFESAGNASSTGRGNGDGGADSAVGAPSEGDDSGGERTVEEADIYRFEGDRLYVLNQFRGLFVFDVSDVDHPRELGRLPLRGTPVEMYVRDGRAYAIISDYFDWYTSGDSLVDRSGSRIVGIDLSDPENPTEIGSVFLDGFVSDTRLVGDVLYAAANRWSWISRGDVATSEARDELVVTSIDLSDPTTMHEVQQLTLEGNGWHVQASPNAFVVAGSRWSSTSYETEVIYIDISSPTGEMAKRADLRIDGYIQDDTAINLHENQLRLLSRDWNEQTTKLRIFDMNEPDTLPLLGELDYRYEGNVYGTTYDGDRLYMIHYQTIDPLEVVDLSDPTHPFIAGILEMPGWVDRIAALGDRLVGLGYDDREGRQVSLTLFDVSDAANPQLLDRLNSGDSGSWGWTTASWERKAWTVNEEAGVILFPYASYSPTTYEPHFALGIVEFTRDDLIARGEVEAAAPVERGALREDRVYALSQAALQVVDIRDRATPTPTATIELVRNVQGYARTGRVGLELITPGLGWYYYGGASSFPPVIRATDLDAPNGEEELGRIELPRLANRLFSYGDYVVALNTGGSRYGWGVEDAGGDGSAADADSGVIRTPGLTVVSFADPANPAVVADFDLPQPEAPTTTDYSLWSYSYWYDGFGRPFGAWQGGDSALDLGDGRFALLRSDYVSCSSRTSCAAADIEPTIQRSRDCTYDESGEHCVDSEYEYVYGNRTDNALFVLDLSGSPALGTEQALPTGTLEQVFARNGDVQFTRAEPSRVDGGRTYVRNYLYRADLVGTSLTGIERTNVPGVVLDVSADGRRMITLDARWDSSMGYDRLAYTLRSCSVDSGRITLEASQDLGVNTGNVLATDNAVYVLTNPEYVYYDTPGGVPTTTRGAGLRAFAPSDLRLAHTEPLGTRAYWSMYGHTDATLALYGGYYSNGLALVDIGRDPLTPAFRKFVVTNQQWSSSVLQDGSTLYLINGPYGIDSVALDD